MKKNIFFATLIAMYLFSFLQIFGQLSISTVIEPPYPNTLADKEKFEDDQLQITIINNQDRSFNVRVGLTLENLANPDVINISTNGPVGDCFIIDQEITELTLADLKEKNISFEDLNIPDNLVQNPEFPEGTYKFCVTLYDCNNRELQISNIGEGCAIFTINKADAPIITQPTNLIAVERDISELDITWMFNKPSGYDGEIKYRVQIVGLDPPETDPKEAFANEPQYLFEKEIIDEMVATFESPDFDEFKKCAIIVRAEAEDINDNLLVRDNGYSEVQTFDISTDDDFKFKTASVFSPHYPLDGDVIPFTFFPVIVKFNPYSEEYKRHEFDFELKENGIVIFDIQDSFKWPEGPRTAQHNLVIKNCGFSNDTSNFPIERAQLLAYNKKADTPPNVFKHLKDSSFYSWKLNASFGDKPKGGGKKIKPGSAFSTFKMGMQSPELEAPEDNKVVKPGEINFSFITSKPPRKLLPDYFILRANAKDKQCVFFSGGVYEKCRLEVDTSAEFKSEELLLDTLYTVGSNTETGFNSFTLFNDIANDGRQNESAVSTFKEKIYKSLTKSQAFTKPDTYYWRVGWLTEPDVENKDYYAVSETWKFIIQDSAGTTDTPPDSLYGGDCIADCEIDEPSSSGSKEITQTSTPQIGFFKLNITEISGSTSGGYTGKGWIDIPFLNGVDVQVTFSNIKANNENRIYEGNVVADKDVDFNLDVLENSVVSKALNFANVNKEEINNKLKEPARWISLFQDGKMALPLALDKTIGGESFLIGLMDMKFEKTKATMQVVFNADLPFGGDFGDQYYSFGTEICFAPNGLGEEGIMYRIEDLEITSQGGYDVVVKGIGDATSLDTSKITYLNWDCKGFKTLQIAGEVIFPRDDLLPVNDQGIVIEGDEKVKATFRTSYTRGANIIAAANFNHRFQHTSLKDWTFEVSNAFYDHSDLENPPNIIFPEGFEDESVFENDKKNLWKGIFIQDISVIVPERFKKFNQTGKLNFAAKNAFYDETGFTADIKAENIINYPEGNLDGWQYSMDTLNLKWISNNFRKGRIDGKIHVVGFDSTEFLEYFALLNREEITDTTEEGEISMDTETTLEFITKPNKDIDYRFSSIKSTLLLEDDSAIKVTYAKEEGGWDILATLNGSLTLDSNVSDAVNKIPTVNFKGVEFQGFQLGNKKGFETGNWSLASPDKFLGGFPVNLSKVEMKKEIEADGVKLGLSFDLSINLAEVVSGKSSMVIWSKINMPGGARHIAEFDSVSLNDFEIAATLGPVEISGTLSTFNNDEVFGDGFGGQVHGIFDIGNGFEADIQFYSGRKNNYRYWLLDAFSTIPKTPLFAGLYLTGLGGGVYHNMKMSSNNSTNFFKSYDFTPNKETYLGLALSARVETEEESAFNADARLTVELDSAIGINMIDFRGRGYLMTKIDERDDNPQFVADLKTQIDFATGTLSGNVDAFVNVKDDWLKGNAEDPPSTLEGYAGIDGYAGTTYMYFDTDGVWRILIGEPDKPISLDFKGWATSESYFMIGSSIPEVTFDSYSSGGVSTSSNMVKGIAFGSRMAYNTDKITYLVFYGKFDADIGYDVALQKNSEINCEGLGQRGINGWYAQGQFNAHFDGEVGITVSIFGASGSYEIISVDAGVELQAKLPNPAYFRGYVDGRYSILNGAISGYCNYKIELGEKCEDPNAPPVDFAAIGSVIPEQNDITEVYTFPQASFNLEMDTPIELYDDEGDKHTYKAKIHEFQIKEGNDVITENYEYNSEKTVATLKQQKWLEANTQHKLYIAVKWQEKVNGSWIDVKQNGSVYLEEINNTFKTKNKPDEIPQSSVVVTYPLNKQRFYLQGEYNKGLVTVAPQVDLDINDSSEEFIARLIKLHPADTIDIGKITVNEVTNITFNLPPLENSKIYAVELVKKQKSQGIGSDLFTMAASLSATAKLEAKVEEIFSTEDGTRLVKRTNVLEGKTLGAIPEKVIYKYHFKTSKYNTLSEKISAMNYKDDDKYSSNGEKELLAIGYSLDEGFDEYDIDGWEEGKPLVSFFTKWESVPNTSLWMENITSKILDCAEAKLFSLDGLNNNVSLGLAYPSRTIGNGYPFVLESTVKVNENYTVFELLTEAEINSSTEITLRNPGRITGNNMGNYFGFNDINKNQSSINGVDLSKISYSLMLASSKPISRLSNYKATYSAFAVAITPSGYTVSSSTSPFSSSVTTTITLYTPPGGGNPMPLEYERINNFTADPTFYYSKEDVHSFYLRYETSLKAYEIYKDTWNAFATNSINNNVCDYFISQKTLVNNRWQAPGFFKIKDYSGTYKISSAYNLHPIFISRDNKYLLNRLNFEIQ